MLKNLKSALKDSVIYGAGNVSSKVVGFILLPLYTSHLTVSDYGVLGILEVTSQFLVSIFSLKLYSAFFRWYWEYPAKQKSMFFSVYVFTALISILMIIIISSFTIRFSFILFDTAQFSKALHFMVVAAGLQIINQVVLTLLRLQSKSLFYSAVNIIKLIFILLLTIKYVALDGKGILGIYIAQGIGQLIFVLICLPYIIANFRFKIEVKLLHDMLKYCWPLVISSLAVIIMTITDRYMLKILSDLSEVGLYSLGFKIANTINVFLVMSVQLAVTPMIYRKMKDPDHKRFYTKLLTYFTYGILMFVLGLSIFSKELFILIIKNNSYWNAQYIVPIISISILFVMMQHMVQTGLLITKKTKLISFVTVVVAVVNILLNALLINYFHAFGAAVATMISQLIFFLLIFYFAQKTYRIPYEVYKLIIMIFTGITLIIMAHFINTLPFPLSLLIKTNILLAFPFILYFFSFYEKKELEYIQYYFRKVLRFTGINKFL